jgi:hypothetical protein
MDVFNAATQDRRACATAASSHARGRLGSGPPSARDPPCADDARRVRRALPAASRTPERQPRLTRAQAAILRRASAGAPTARANDGMVPTLSQVWGDVIHAAWADHLDVIGHFHLPTHVPPHFDWLTSGSGFDRTQFEQVWREVAAYVAAGEMTR